MKFVIFGLVLLFCGQTFAVCLSPLCLKVESLEKRLEAAEGEIARLKSRELGGVIFSAGMIHENKAIGPFKTSSTMVYKNVVVNIGNAYNSFTGIFTAPITGVYYFTMFVHAGGQHPSCLVLYKNDISVLRTHDHKSDFDTADNASIAMFLPLQRGDVVYTVLPANNHIWTSTFNGFLVKAE